jgi:hypothetical protein
MLIRRPTPTTSTAEVEVQMRPDDLSLGVGQSTVVGRTPIARPTRLTGDDSADVGARAAWTATARAWTPATPHTPARPSTCWHARKCQPSPGLHRSELGARIGLSGESTPDLAALPRLRVMARIDR